MGGDILRPDFSKGHKDPSTDIRRRSLHGVTRLVVEPAEPIDEAIEAFKAYKLFQKDPPFITEDNEQEVAKKLFELGANQRELLQELSPEAKDQAINIARQELEELIDPPMAQ